MARRGRIDGGGRAEKGSSGLRLDGGLTRRSRMGRWGWSRVNGNLSRLLWGVIEMGSGMSTVTVEALSARDSSVSVMGARIVSPQNFSVVHKGIEVLASGGSEGGGRGKSSFLNADIDLTGKLNVTKFNVEIRRRKWVQTSHFPRVRRCV